MNQENMNIPISSQGTNVSAILTDPENATAMVVMAHGAGAGITHPFMESVAALMDARNLAVLRFNFPYMDEGKKRPDPMKKAVSVIDEVIRFAGSEFDYPLFAGGKSYGGRMASWAMAEHPDLPVHGIIFWGFPLHAPGKPSAERAEHLKSLPLHMLFLQGTRDTLANPELLIPLIKEIPNASLFMEEGADHSFHVLKQSGRTDKEVLVHISDEVAAWINAML